MQLIMRMTMAKIVGIKQAGMHERIQRAIQGSTIDFPYELFLKIFRRYWLRLFSKAFQQRDAPRRSFEAVSCQHGVCLMGVKYVHRGILSQMRLSRNNS